MYLPPGGRLGRTCAPALDFRNQGPWPKGKVRAQSAPIRSMAFQLPFCVHFSKTKNVFQNGLWACNFRYTPAPPGA